ncbi:MAG: 50S ribosomal protein L4, partial [Acidimicrobiia bacterium]
TKAALAALATVTERSNVLVVAARGDQLTVKSLRNVPQVHLIVADQLNTYDVLCSDDIVFTQDALEAFLDGKATVAAPSSDDDTAAAQRTAETTASAPSAKKATAKKATAKKATAKKTTVKKATAKKATAKKTSAAPAKKATAKKATAKKGTAKTTEEDGK